MFQFFWVRAASVWIAVLYAAMGALLFFFPAASSTLFVWALAAGVGAYGMSHLVRYLQSRKTGHPNAGDLFLTILPTAFSVFSLLWPEAVLSVLPLVLGSLLLVDGVGKLPLAVAGVQNRIPSMIPLALSALLPVLVGILIILNPFTTTKIVVMVFGAALIADGVSDLITVLLEKRASKNAVVVVQKQD